MVFRALASGGEVPREAEHGALLTWAAFQQAPS